jgi:hypothetical protein
MESMSTGGFHLVFLRNLCLAKYIRPYTHDQKGIEMQSLCTHPLPCTLLAVIGRLKSTWNIEYIKEKTNQKFNKHAHTHSHIYTCNTHAHLFKFEPMRSLKAIEHCNQHGEWLYSLLLCYSYNSPTSGWSVNTVQRDSQWVPHNHCFCWDIKTRTLHANPRQQKNC